MIIKQLPADDIVRLGEIDRSEHITLTYKMEAGRLAGEPADIHVLRWPDGAGSPRSVEAHIAEWRPLAEKGVLLGALDGERLAGVAILRYELEPGMAELAVLHVSREYRRQGVGKALTEEVARLAAVSGASRLYVAAIPSGSAVGFYRSQGFTPVREPNPERFADEPDDIHMVREL